MERIIKFRGKRLDNGQWVYGGIEQPKGEVRINQVVGGGSIRSVAVDPETVAQFTGLCDRYGVEIYGDDYVTYKVGPGPWVKASVHYSDGWAQWFKGAQPLATYKKTTKVLGNRHDGLEPAA